MPKLPDFEGLAMFAKVAEERSYAGAARSMDVSVATVSRAVSRLEDQLGGRLFNRSSRRLALTDFGRGLADRAARIYAEAKEVECIAIETARRPRGVVRFAVPMSFGTHWVAPILPDFFQQYPDVAVDLHLSDEKIDLIGAGFDAALRVGVLEDSSLVVKRLAVVRRFIVAAPSYLARYGRPGHPDDLTAHHCLGYAYRANRDVWHLTNKAGDSVTVTPVGPLRVTNVDALLPTLLAGLAIAELPEFVAFDLLRTGQVEVLLADWTMALGGLYFVTPTARARSAKVEALSSFLTKRLSRPGWHVDPSKGPSASGRP
ncbi:MAG TPA: LysR family transcriptional regulator [Bradyrhizobium sp.]|jgi:DNA-binding transcriptional LysR family regulator|uniref:LysR family transcriptional regulator n=1 Tax=Bradyrhizobium sp. TaxID=376 RepID=UPI002BDDD5D8|nr:LysR family transcriptional regulator [Bradyrhizobium sp.]HTA99831.1 LysR family transcriptional regulator [Bradyrhizobium sp.]